MSTSRAFPYVALPLILFAAATFILNAQHQSTWSDEGWNLWVVRGTSIETIFTRLSQNHHPPAYFLGLAGWQHLVGESRIALRFLSIAGALLTVALLYRIGADHFGRITGLAAALLYAAFEQPVYYAQAMRHYGWLVLGVCLMTLFFLRYLRQPCTPLLIGYSLSVVFTLYTMYLGVFIIAIQGLVGIVLWRGAVRDKARLVLAWMGAGLLLLPWFVYALPQQWQKVQRGVIGGYHNSFATTGENVLLMSDLIFGGQFVVGSALCLFACSQIARDRWEDRRLTQITVVLCGVGLFVVLLVLNLRIGILAERTLFLLTPFIVLLLGYGIQRLQPGFRAVLLSVSILWLILTPPAFVPHLNTDQAAAWVAAGYSPGDLVLLETGFDDVAYEFELERVLPKKNRSIFRSYYEYDYPSDAAMMSRLGEVLEGHQRVWVVNWNLHPRFAELLPTLGFVQQGRDKIAVGENDPIYERFPTITLTFYARPPTDFSRVNFADLLTLESALMTDQIQRGETLHVDLWWSVPAPLDRDYSTGVYLLDQNGITRLQQIGPQQPTTAWQPAELIFDRHTLDIPADLPGGSYQVIAAVYWYQTADQPLEIVGSGERYAILGTIKIE